jgi:hypothetical protein
MAIVDYGGTVTECLLSDGFPERPDGWFLKHLDTSITYFRRSGVWVECVLGLSFAPATKSGRVTTDGSGDAEIIFGTPFIDDEYSIALSCLDCGGPPARPPLVYKYARTKDGFKIKTRTINGIVYGNVEVSWLATRDFNE